MSAQSMDALGLANRLRVARATKHRAVAALTRNEGLRFVAGVLRSHATGELDPSSPLAGAVVTDVLQWPHRVGAQIARRIALDAGVVRVAASSRVRVRELTVREASALADELELLAGGEA